MTILSPNGLDTTVSQDGQVAGITAAGLRTVIDSLAGMVGTVKTVSATAALVDRGTVLEFNSATSVNCTIPPNSSVAFDIGTVLGIYQMGAGQVVIVAGAGVTLRTSSSLTTRAQLATAFARKRATDEWVVYGELT